jgi:hypothetical protein
MVIFLLNIKPFILILKSLKIDCEKKINSLFREIEGVVDI